MEIDACNAQIQWDGNSFYIRGLFKENMIKIEGVNLDGK